ncbi:MAG: response regulator [Cytophagaceae bacterium]|nr:response regulator [Cytophagaceae bacterium]
MSKKILIAEDSSVIQNLSKKILENQNYIILSAKNGKEVIALLSKEPIDLILMDINMPQMDGMTCAREIRKSADPVIAKVPIIAITGNARNYSESDFSEAGFNDFLPKPLDFDRLVELVKTYIA